LNSVLYLKEEDNSVLKQISLLSLVIEIRIAKLKEWFSSHEKIALLMIVLLSSFLSLCLAKLATCM
jgi:hypothetical protein